MTETFFNRSSDQSDIACAGLLKQPRMLPLTVLMCWLLAVARPALAPPQRTPPAPSPAATSMTQPGLVLRAESRLVIVDVTVRDRIGVLDEGTGAYRTLDVPLPPVE